MPSHGEGDENDCRVVVRSAQNLDSGFLEFSASSTSSDVYYKAAAVFALDGGVFDGESIIVMPDAPGQSIKVGDRQLAAAGGKLAGSVGDRRWMSCTGVLIDGPTVCVRVCVWVRPRAHDVHTLSHPLRPRRAFRSRL